MRIERAGFAPWLYIAAVFGLAGCAGGSGQLRPIAPDQSPAALYPLAAGSAWSYDVETDEGPAVLAIARVTEVQGGVAAVATGPAAVQRYASSELGIARVGEPGFLLKAPLAVGASWESAPAMRAQVVSMQEQVSTAAGNFTACVLVEEQNAQSGQRVRTTYCPGVGPALVISQMEVRGRMLTVTARLRGFAVGDSSEP